MEKSSEGIYRKMAAAMDLQWSYYAKKFKVAEMTQHHREAAESMFYAGVIESCAYIIKDETASKASKAEATSCLQYCAARLHVDR